MAKDTYFGLGKDVGRDLSTQKDLLYTTLESEVSKLDIPLGEVSRSIAASAADFLYKPEYLSRKEFVDSYKEARLKHEIGIAKGNLTQVTRNLYKESDPDRINVLRRNVNDNVAKFGLGEYVDQKRPWKIDFTAETPKGLEAAVDYAPQEKVVSALSNGLQAYQSVLHPQVYGEVKQRIETYASSIAEAVAPLVPTRKSTVDYLVKQTEGMTWDDSVAHVERIAVEEALKNAGNDKKKAAEYLGNSVKTLQRKIKKFGLDKPKSKEESRPVSEIDRLKDIIKKKKIKDKDQRPRPASQAEYFQTVAAGYEELDDLAA